jgi:electron transport complex protein RnfC
MARAQAKLNQSPEEKLRANLEALQARLIKAQEKAEQAYIVNDPSATALQKGVEKMREKIADVQAELTALLAQPVDPECKAAERSATNKAMAKAKEKATAMAAMSNEEKQAQQRRALESRLQKAKERLQQAEMENDPHMETFRLAVKKLEEKLDQ